MRAVWLREFGAPEVLAPGEAPDPVAGPGQASRPELAGARVVTSTGGSGGYAERVVVDASAVFPVPDEVATLTAVALLADGRTATMMTRAAATKPGERVLVEPAAR